VHYRIHVCFMCVDFCSQDFNAACHYVTQTLVYLKKVPLYDDWESVHCSLSFVSLFSLVGVFGRNEMHIFI
jgi:hypothetical protein